MIKLSNKQISYMDEINFPTGYGEENDYCLRAIEGFSLAVADNLYVYHSKSKALGMIRERNYPKKEV